LNKKERTLKIVCKIRENFRKTTENLQKSAKNAKKAPTYLVLQWQNTIFAREIHVRSFQPKVPHVLF